MVARIEQNRRRSGATSRILRLRSGQSNPKAGCERKGFIYGQALNHFTLSIGYLRLQKNFHCSEYLNERFPSIFEPRARRSIFFLALFSGLPGNAYLDSLYAKTEWTLQRHSREGGNPGKAAGRGRKTVLCLHHGKQTKRYAVHRSNVKSSAKGMASQTGCG